MTGFCSALQALIVNVEHTRAKDDDPTVCPACHKRLRTTQGLATHLSTAKSCRWYKKGKLRALTLPGEFAVDEDVLMREVNEPLPDGLEGQMEEEPDQVMEDFHDRLFDLIPIGNPSEHPRSPNPSSALDMRVEDVHPTAGKVIHMDETVHQIWRREFGGSDTNGDVVMEDLGEGTSMKTNMFAPFESELEWRVACWAIQDGIGHKSFDRLMAIPGVSERLGLSYHNIRGLHKIVNSVPPRACWKTRELWFKNDPEHKHIIYHRNPIDAVKTLLGNPAHTNNIVYRPKRVFTNASRDSRIYNEMWTGDWWNTVQVSIQ
ncbi:hypothetical protein F4604DRAFT_1566002 [Suillus subluteus]|nr:hypothetical protein F4604DRAFT_1566002 [Suillus subluteus]